MALTIGRSAALGFATLLWEFIFPAPGGDGEHGPPLQLPGL
jgi:hypothetical protein